VKKARSIFQVCPLNELIKGILAKNFVSVKIWGEMLPWLEPMALQSPA